MRERKNLQNNYMKGLIPRMEFLVSMGALTLKGRTPDQRVVVDQQEPRSSAIVPNEDSDSGDSLR